MAFKTKQAALKAAHKALGAEAIENMDFVLRNTGAGWEHAEMAPVTEPAKKARAKRKDLPEVEMVGDQVVSGHRRAAKAAQEKRPVVARDVTTGKVSLKMAVPKAEAPAKKAKAPPPRVAGEARTIPAAPAGQTKTEQLVGMMRAKGGATSKQMEEAVGWQPHSVRGLIGTLKQRGWTIESTKVKGEPTVYRVRSAPKKPPVTQEVGDVL